MNWPPTIFRADAETTGTVLVLVVDSTAVSSGVFHATTGATPRVVPQKRPKREPTPPREQQREYLRRQRAQSRGGR